MKQKADSIWIKCLKIIKDNIDEIEFSTWLKPISPISFDDSNFTLAVPSHFFMEYLEESYADLIYSSLEKVVGKPITLQYQVLVEMNTNTSVNYSKDTNIFKVKKDSTLPKIISPFDKIISNNFDSQLKASYTFNNFFESDCNKFQISISKSIVENPGATFNPCFMHGASGVGKTHLCHAIGNMFLERWSDKKVLYVTANTFKIQYADAGRFNTTNDFINFYQNIDLLIIDDVHEIAGIEKTQNALFNIFNHLHQNNKQLIFTSDKSPAELAGVEERLLTRFRWGVTTEMLSPDEDLRVKIIQNKIKRDGVKDRIPFDVIKYIAKNVTKNARDLEGVIVSIMAHLTISDREEVDIAFAKKIIGQTIKFIEKKKITAELIQNVVCDYFNVQKEDLQSSSRKREFVKARQTAMYLIKGHTQMSLTQIGGFIGKRNHATVLHAINSMKTQIEIDKSLKKDIFEIENRLTK